MKHLNEYINESLAVGTIILLTLCGACASHFGIKGLKKIGRTCGNFWDWALGQKDLHLSASASESLEDDNELLLEAKKFDKTKVQPMQVTDQDILDKLIEFFKIETKKKSGFYVFNQLFKDIPELKQLNKAPYYANYVVFMDAGDKDNEEQKPKFYGMLGFSLKYWKTIAKKGKDEKVKEAASKLIKYINIFGVQTDKKYAKQGLFEVYLNDMKNAVKEAKMEGLTIKYDNEDVVEVFKKYGFEKIEGLDGYMILTLNKKEEE